MKRVPIVSNLYDISTKDLPELTLYENDMKVTKFKKRPVKVHLEVWDFDYLYLEWIGQEKWWNS